MAAACSPEGRYYAALSVDGRLKVWNTETNVLLQEYTPDLHLSSPPVCLTWITLNTASPNKNKRKKKSSGPDIERLESTFIALGTTSGKILIYSVAQAKVETVLLDSKKQDLRNNNVTSLDWDRTYGLFSSTANCLYEWDVAGADVKNKYNISVESKNKGSDNVTAIKIVPHSLATQSRYVVTASCQLRLWSLAPLTVLRTMVGHSGAVSALSLAHFPQLGKCYVASCTKTERLLSFWDVSVTSDDVGKGHVNGDRSPSKKHRRQTASETIVAPAHNFVMEDAARCVDVAAREADGAGRVDVAVATRSGVVHYYGRVLNGSSTKPIKPSVTIHVSTEEPKPLPLLCCQFTPHGDEAEMVVGYEATPGRILYERVRPDTSNRTQVLVRAAPAPETKAAARGEASGTRSAEATSVTYAQPGAAGRKRSASGSKVEPPMEARLANLALDTSERGRSAVNQNYTKLLVQGLHSNDKSLILAVLQQTDVAAATRTVSALPPSYVPALLEQLTEMASRKTSQCKAVCVWLSALIRCHSALLLATLNTGATTDKFAQLLAVMTQRRSHLCQLLNLKGRLELTIAQRTGRSVQDIDTEAVIDYIDTSSEESDMEVVGAADSDSAAWEESEAGSEESKAGSDEESEAGSESKAGSDEESGGSGD